MKPIRYYDHAEARMEQRGIAKVDVERIIRDPPITLPTRGRRQRVIGYVGDRGLRVVFQETETTVWVVSANWVSK